MKSMERRIIRRIFLGCLIAVVGLVAFTTSAPAQTYVFNQADFSTGASPVAVVAGDFNGDGKLDLATANSGDNTVSVLIGNPDGSFQPHVDYKVGGFPSAIASGDFNGDGKLDLAVTSYDGTVSILLGNGDGTFQVAGNYQAASAPDSIAVGDFNGDGKTDLAVANSGSNSVSVLIGRGDGTFNAPIDYLVGGGPISIVTGDFNNDGKLDVAVANSGDGTVSVLLGIGNGTFRPAISSNASSYYATVASIAAADFNGDGKLDLVVGGTAVSILLGNGDGSFQAPVGVGGGGCSAAVAVGDFNRDGKADVVTSSGPYGNPLAALLGNGDGTFQLVPALYGGPCIYLNPVLPSLAVGDFNGDGGLDVAVTNASSNNLSVILGDFDGTFGEQRTGPGFGVFSGMGWTHYYGFGAMAAGDFTGDGNLDLAVGFSCPDIGCGSGINGVSILLGKGDGTFPEGEAYTLSTAPFFSPPPPPPDLIEVGDFNGDGKQDVAVAVPYGAGNAWYLLLGNGDGTFQPPANISGPPSGTIFTPFVDFNGDGKPDQAILTQNGLLIALDGGPTISGPTGSLAFLSVGDFDDDGIADVAVINDPGDGISPILQVFLNSPVIGIYPIGLKFHAGPSSGTNTQNVTISNPGLAPLKISTITITGDFTETNNCGSTLFSASSCTITVTSTLAESGTSTGSLSITDNAPGSPHVVSLTAEAGPAATLNASTLSVGGQVVGTTSGAHTVTLTNSGNLPLTITSMTISPSSFTETSTCGSSLAAGASCTITVTFTPAASGAIKGVLSIADNAPGSPQKVNLSGTGQDFAIGPYNLSQTIPAGMSAPFDLQLAPEGGFNQTVSLACSGTPAQSTCLVSPASVMLDGRNYAAVELKVTTERASSAPPAKNRPPGSPRLIRLPAAQLAALLGIGLLAIARRPKTFAPLRPRITAMLSALVLLTIAWIGCGGGPAFVYTPPSGGTPAGNYEITVTATSGHLSHAVTVGLTVK